MKLSICICFFVLKFLNASFDDNMINFFLNVLAINNVKYVQVYSCFSPKDRIQMMKVFSQSNIRSSFLTRLAHSNLNPFYFILDVSSENSTNIIHESEKLGYFRSHYKWLFFDSTRSILTEPSDIATVLSDVHLRLDSELLVAFQNSDASEVLLYDVYATGKNQNFSRKIVEFGFWTPFKQLVLKSQLSKYNRRKNLTDTFIRCTIVNVKPFFNKSLDFHYRDVKDQGVDIANKFSYILFMHVQEIHNFSYNFTLTSEWFGKIPGGMDAGLGKLFYDDAVDVGTSVAILKVDRITRYDFIFPIYPFRTAFIYRNFKLSGVVHDDFLRPFVSSLWCMVLFAIAVFCAVLKLLFTVGHRSIGEGNESWHTSLLLIWGVICQQGASFVPKSLSGRCVLITMLIMSLMLYNYYTSSIVSTLLSGSASPIKTIEQLTNSKLIIGLEDAPYVKTFFAITNDTGLQRLYKTKVLTNSEPYVPVSYGIKNVQRGGYAYHSEPHASYSIIQKEFEPYQICQLAEVNLFAPSVLWVVSKKHSEYTKMFSIGYNKMLQAGIIKRELLIWITKKPKCLKRAHSTGVDFDHLFSAFLVLGFGCGAALLALLTESCVYKMNKRQHLNWHSG